MSVCLQGGVRDLADECIVVQDKDFDVENSIFGVLPEKMKMAMAANQKKPYWSDGAIARADAAYADVAAVEEERKPLLQFMASECNFKLEHADGSFMDHLTFCRDYCAAHYPGVSSTPLFIHSIMGVGTNVSSPSAARALPSPPSPRAPCLCARRARARAICLSPPPHPSHTLFHWLRFYLIPLSQIFPMEAEKIPMLASVLTPDEMDHVQAFPSILRIVGPIGDELSANPGRELQAIKFHRLIDNEVISLTGPQLWVQLNYHLIHMMDFLPIADWSSQRKSLTGFARLHSVLEAAGQLGVQIDLNLADSEGLTLADILGEASTGLGGNDRFAADRSAAIGHSLDFELLWAPAPKL